MLLGGRAAFAADASVHLTVISNTAPVLREPWVAEGLCKAHLDAAGINVTRVAVAFCILGTDGACRYPGELLRSADVLASRDEGGVHVMGNATGAAPAPRDDVALDALLSEQPEVRHRHPSRGPWHACAGSLPLQQHAACPLMGPGSLAC